MFNFFRYSRLRCLNFKLLFHIQIFTLLYFGIVNFFSLSIFVFKLFFCSNFCLKVSTSLSKLKEWDFLKMISIPFVFQKNYLFFIVKLFIIFSFGVFSISGKYFSKLNYLNFGENVINISLLRISLGSLLFWV